MLLLGSRLLTIYGLLHMLSQLRLGLVAGAGRGDHASGWAGPKEVNNGKPATRLVSFKELPKIAS